MDLLGMIRTQTDVALRLTKHVFQAEARDTNLVFSPLSTHVLLSLIASGSSGPTLHQLLSLLNSTSAEHLASFASQVVALVFADGSPKGGPHLSVANGVWIDSSLPLKQSFKQVLGDVYKAACTQADFQTRPAEVAGEVNSWAEKETNGLIREVLPPGSVDSSARFILANALYFKGAWNEKFDASKTKDDDFHQLNGSSVKVPFMTSKKKQKACSYSGFKVLGLPYKRGEDKRRFSMYFFLPDARDGLPALIEKVSSESGFLERHLPFQSVAVGDFRIPRFKIQFGFEASNVLKGLGVVAPFSDGGLTEMVDSPMGQNLYVSNVFHKSFIEVNEEGTEAAAATASVIRLRSIAFEDTIDFVADHPFLYMIREDATGVVLFSGHLLNPLQG